MAAVDFLSYFARTRGGKLACLDLESGRSLNYAALDARAWRTAATIERLLAACGKSVRGERVAVLARNSSDIVALYWACQRVGAVLQPLNWRLAPPELAAQGRDGDPAVILFAQEFEAGANELTRACPEAIVLSVDGAGKDTVDGALSRAPERPSRSAPAAESDVTTLLYTSGTTGLSKGVMVTAGNARANGTNYALAATVGGDAVFLCDMPMFHVVGLFAMARTVVQQGATLLISTRFDADETVRRIADPVLGVTHYFCVPQMAQLMRQSCGYDAAAFQRLVALQTGGAPHAEAAVRAWLDEGVMLIDGYGMSEAGTVLGMPPGDFDLLRRKAGAAGLPALLTELRLVGRDGADVSEGETGEIWLRGPTVTPGYWRNVEATASAFEDGWLKSGDAARRDGDGFVTIVDRWKDMFISGGENVYPAEVEAAILELDGVVEVAVFGVPDSRWGETGVCYVACAQGVPITLESIVAHCRRRLAGYKTPKHVRMVASLPRTASGKVQKALLRTQWIDTSQEK